MAPLSSSCLSSSSPQPPPPVRHGFFFSSDIPSFPPLASFLAAPHPGVLFQDFVLSYFLSGASRLLTKVSSDPDHSLAFWITADPCPPDCSIVAGYLNFWMGAGVDSFEVTLVQPKIFRAFASCSSVLVLILRLQGLSHGGILFFFHDSLTNACSSLVSSCYPVSNSNSYSSPPTLAHRAK